MPSKKDSDPVSLSSSEAGEELSGGCATVYESNRDAFSLPIPYLTASQTDSFFIGNSFFHRNWVIAPSSTAARDGLGPLFNAKSCSGCHLLDGRGTPPDRNTDPMISMLFRLSIPGVGEHGGVIPEPTYGDQLSGAAIPGVPTEGQEQIDYEEVTGYFTDGEGYSLRKPTYRIINLSYGPLHPETNISPRVAPAMIGLGLLEAVTENQILAAADPKDQNQDGISGRPNHVWDVETQSTVLGRFGWKANQPNLRQQVAGAFLGDIGISSSVFPQQNCTSAQIDCQLAISGGAPELDEETLKAVLLYSETLAVPARRNWNDSTVLKGKSLFLQSGCAACHTPLLVTGDVPQLECLSKQTIRPYTDLLLHDMGDELADNRGDFEATGKEWRTPPLWGIGLVKTVNDHTHFLHDGRARDLAEAILWHGGEAQRSQQSFLKMNSNDRTALIRFLESL